MIELPTFEACSAMAPIADQPAPENSRLISAGGFHRREKAYSAMAFHR